MKGGVQKGGSTKGLIRRKGKALDHFHLAEREPVATAIAAAAACDTLDELHAAIRAYKGHQVAAVTPWTPSWPPTRPTPPQGSLMIVSEKPEDEDRVAGAPFSGAYGAVMREALAVSGVDLAQMHVAYAVHWAPGDERSPNATQISASRPFLMREIEIVRPRAILVQGRAVLEAMFMIRDPITPLLNETLLWKRGDLRIECYVGWHPAYCMRFKTQSMDFNEQIHGFVERFGMPDGSKAAPSRYRRAA